MQRLFVYGTLRPGDRAAGLLSSARRLGPAILRGTLYDVQGRYPALVLEGEHCVHGQLWEVPSAAWPALDRYEGVGQGLYRRVRVPLRGGEAWTYVAGPALRPRLRPEWRVEGGRWGTESEE